MRAFSAVTGGLLVLALGVGCVPETASQGSADRALRRAAGPSYFPMDVGNTWTYEVRVHRDPRSYRALTEDGHNYRLVVLDRFGRYSKEASWVETYRVTDQSARFPDGTGFTRIDVRDAATGENPYPLETLYWARGPAGAATRYLWATAVREGIVVEAPDGLPQDAAQPRRLYHMRLLLVDPVYWEQPAPRLDELLVEVFSFHTQTGSVVDTQAAEPSCEDTSVPSGTFQALHVITSVSPKTGEGPAAPLPWREHTYYAAKIGLVKWVQEDHQGITVEKELLSHDTRG